MRALLAESFARLQSASKRAVVLTPGSWVRLERSRPEEQRRCGKGPGNLRFASCRETRIARNKPRFASATQNRAKRGLTPSRIKWQRHSRTGLTPWRCGPRKAKVPLALRSISRWTTMSCTKRPRFALVGAASAAPRSLHTGQRHLSQPGRTTSKANSYFMCIT